MYPYYGNAHPQPHPAHYPQAFANAAPHPQPIPYAAPHAAPQAAIAPIPDEATKKRYEENDKRLYDALSHARFPSSQHKQECAALLNHLRLCRNLFLRTYEHLASCCQGRYLHVLVQNAKDWALWGSVGQLVHYRMIQKQLVGFWAEATCRDHKSLRKNNFETDDDESDLLCLLLYCAKKEELYDLCKKPPVQGFKESDQIIELLWQVLMRTRKNQDVHRLRACIYRMARKSGYLPQALQIAHPQISQRRTLAQGGHGIVTRAVLNGHHDIVIKKILCNNYADRKNCLEMFAGEAILWKTLDHKNIVPFGGIVVEDSFDIGLVSPFFKNGNLIQYLQTCKPQQLQSVVRKLAKGLAKGLEYIHSHDPPIIHGDLKADNVLVDDGGNACLSDFGQSYASDSGKFLDSTRVGLALTPMYWMAPELLMGDDRTKATDKSDVYSFGCVLYEMVSGQYPFHGVAPATAVGYVLEGRRPARPGSIKEDDPVWRAAKACWEGNPNSRPSAKRLISSL